MDASATVLKRRVRLAAPTSYTEHTGLHRKIILRAKLTTGLTFEGTHVPLIGAQGILKPTILPEMLICVPAVPAAEGRAQPNVDEVKPDALLLYHHRGTDPFHRDYGGVRLAISC